MKKEMMVLLKVMWFLTLAVDIKQKLSLNHFIGQIRNQSCKLDNKSDDHLNLLYHV